MAWSSGLVAIYIATLMITYIISKTWITDFHSINDFHSQAGLINWWIHSACILGFLILIPRSKHFHLVIVGFTIFFKNFRVGQLQPLDFENEEFGLAEIGDLSSKNILDAMTCVECGRCQDLCPAFNSGKLLNPKALALNTRDTILDKKDILIGNAIEKEALWQCTSCGACEANCPVGVEHLPILMGIRRSEVAESKFGKDQATLYNSLENQGNPWGISPSIREDFIEAEKLPIFDENKDYLYWVGCAGYMDPSAQDAVRATQKVLDAAGISYGVLPTESCTGDTARRTGNEFLFQMMAEANIENLNDHKVKKIITGCPHCLQTIGQDYKDFGSKFEIEHTSTFISGLMDDLPHGAAQSNEVVFHDPCYLGRYQNEYNSPRQLLADAGSKVLEAELNKEKSFCCGAGGGLMFLGEEAEPRINHLRTEQLLETGAKTVAVNCPFCKIMMNDAVTAKDLGNVEVKDVVEIVAQTIEVVYQAIEKELLELNDAGLLQGKTAKSLVESNEIYARVQDVEYVLNRMDITQ